MKYLTYIALLAAGLLLGYLFFGGAENIDSDPALTTSATGNEIWTCSMDPQVRQPEPGDCPICGMDLIPASSMVNDDPTVLEMTEAAVALANIQTTVIGATGDPTAETDPSPAHRLSGRIVADERRTSTAVSDVAGRIEKLYVSFTGESVRAGQQLADLYAPELISAQRELLEALRLAELSPELLEAARNKLRYLRIDETLIRQIEESGTLRETFPIYASESGVVAERFVSTGDYVRAGEPLFELIDLSKLWVELDAYETDLARLGRGNRIEFTTPAVPGRSFAATIDFVDPLIDPATRTATLRAEVSNPGGRLKPDMLVTAAIYPRRAQPKAGAEAVLLVPKSAVLWTGKRSVVYTKISDLSVPTYQFQEVELGEATGDQYLVVDGLEAGDEVVTNGNFSLDAAAQLNNQASMMNRNVRIRGAAEPEPVSVDFTATTPPAFQQQLASLTQAYLPLKTALVASDAEAARAATTDFSAALKNVEMTLLTGEGHDYWMQQQSALRDHTDLLRAATDLEKIRQQFEYLSTALIGAVAAFGLGDATLYVQHCPMAFGNTGADWLAAEEDILNPYFGDAMLTCGYVKTEL